MAFKSVILVVDDVMRSRFLYENTLGMTVAEDHGIYNLGFVEGLALYQKSFFEQLSGGLTVKPKANNCVVYFEVNNPADLDRQLTSLGIEIIHHCKEQPWGQKTFRAYDYDGHILEIAEKMDTVFTRLYTEGKTIDQIASITGLPVNQIHINKNN